MNKDVLPGVMYGLAGTAIMSVFMMLVMMMGFAPLPEPFPFMVIKAMFYFIDSAFLLVIITIFAHFVYGSFWSAVFVSLYPEGRLGAGIAWGVFLWVVMNIVWLPFIGMRYSATLKPDVAFITLLFHLIYGATLGYLCSRRFADMDKKE
ncbi:MAG: hypothetical protein IH795_02635 [Bacteroidetes bacterium]|nr:hypothetical protein [Bacteroidota bacterium]